MELAREILTVGTRGSGFTDISRAVDDFVSRSGVRTGMASAFLQHTSASLIIQENADPAVLRDLQKWMSEVAPESRRWEHDAEGPDDMPAHARAAITRTSEQIPIVDGRLGLGTWQGLYVWEHRHTPHQRRVVLTAWGIV